MVVWLVFFNLTQTRVTWKEGASSEELFPPDWPMGHFFFFLLLLKTVPPQPHILFPDFPFSFIYASQLLPTSAPLPSVVTPLCCRWAQPPVGGAIPRQVGLARSKQAGQGTRESHVPWWVFAFSFWLGIPKQRAVTSKLNKPFLSQVGLGQGFSQQLRNKLRQAVVKSVVPRGGGKKG